MAWNQNFSLLPTQFAQCPCGQVIDAFGDHLLGCGHGPLRIKRHDALRDIIWQALLLDNSRAIREQRCDNSNERPGDIFHPDFQLGKPAFFDISVCNSLQPSYLSIAACSAGAAGEAGEMEKDSKYDSRISASGALFFPLIVESLGLWTSHSISVLRTIAGKSTLFSGLSKSLAVSNLMQQLGVKLWSFNAKMLLQSISHIQSFSPYLDYF